MSRREMDATRRKLLSQGFTAVKTSSQHWKYTHPDMNGPVFASDTPGDRHAHKNLLRDIRSRMRRKTDAA